MTRQEILKQRASKYLSTLTTHQLIVDLEELGCELVNVVEYKESYRGAVIIIDDIECTYYSGSYIGAGEPSYSLAA